MHYFDYGENFKKLLQPWNPVRRKNFLRQAGVTNTKANTFHLQADVEAAKPADLIIPSRYFRGFSCESEKQHLAFGVRILLGIQNKTYLPVW